MILEFFYYENNCIDLICTLEDVIVIYMSCQRMIEKNFCKYGHLDSEMSEVYYTVSHFRYAPLMKCKITRKRNTIF